MLKQLRQPSNWQDFEKLCKKLWGEIWDCKDIKLNGSPGQKQNGVDIYGIPKGESNYFGIQCKLKEVAKNSKLKIEDLESEILQAKTFNPKLKSYIIATTANKDATIEEYIRIKCLEHKQNDLFDINIYFWEDIVDLLDENKYTYNWYMNNQGFKNNYKIKLTFDNNDNIIKLVPKYIRETIHYKYKENPFSSLLDDNLFKDILKASTDMLKVRDYFYNNQTTYNHSIVYFKLKLENIGNSAINNYKIYFEVKGNFKEVGRCNLDISQIIPGKKQYCVKKLSEINSFVIEPFKDILVPSDKVVFDNMYLCIYATNEDKYLSIYPKEELVEITWKLVSTEINENGKLGISILPEFNDTEIEDSVEDKSLEKTEIKIKEYFEDLSKQF